MNKDEIAVSVQNVSKTFKLPHEHHSSIKSKFVNIFNRSKTFEKQKVLTDISFEIKKGEFFGIVGRNGSGKSTLLKLLGGIYSPDKGRIIVNGLLTPFIELGVGFNPELTGRENVYLNGALLGFNRKEMFEMYDEIVAFAELEQFMDQKLKNYSSGMQVRLAFSIAIRANSDILLIDEVLAVGDVNFQRKCFDIFKQIKKSGRTVVFVTHDMGAVEEFCDKAMLIENGKIITIDKSYKVAREYRRLMSPAEMDTDGSGSEPHKKWGNGRVSIKNVSIKASDGKILKKITDDQHTFLFSMDVLINENVIKPIFGITIRDAAGAPLFLSNTKSRYVKTGSYTKGSLVTISWELKNIFNTGKYNISPAVADQDGMTIYDWHEDMVTLNVNRDNYLPGPIHYEHRIKVSE